MTTEPKTLTADTPVLIVDDSLQYASVLKKMLGHGFGLTNIKHIDNTEEALTWIAENPGSFELLFVDFRFPSGTTGGDLLEQLSKANLLQDKVAFLITSEPSSENVKQAVIAGAAGVVAKPFDREELRRQIIKALRGRSPDPADSF